MTKKTYIILITIFIFIGCLFFFISNRKTNYYNFNNPSQIVFLPKILNEISGLSFVNSNILTCIQDEKGIVFFYDFKRRKIINTIKFAKSGDYEGVSYLDSNIFVLRSDGILFEINLLTDNNTVTKHITSIPANNNEALCYDKENNILLIGCKVKSGDEGNKNERHIYSFDLDSKSISLNPLFTINKKDLVAFCNDNNIDIPIRKKKKKGKNTKGFKMGISAISIHPITKELYVLCANDYLILRYKNNKLIGIDTLDKNEFPKAEGITFNNKGDLFISNEGKKGKANIMKFEL